MKFSTVKRRFRWITKLLYLAVFRCSNMTSVDTQEYFSVGVHIRDRKKGNSSS